MKAAQILAPPPPSEQMRKVERFAPDEESLFGPFRRAGCAEVGAYCPPLRLLDPGRLWFRQTGLEQPQRNASGACL